MLALHRPNLLLYDKYLCFVWFILGFPGNFLSFFVWIRRKMRPSSGCYLAALAFNDFIFLLFNVVNKANFAWETNILNVPVFCEVFPVIFYSTQYLSLFFVLAFTVERYISVCHPYQRER
ncbi:hypothetical protein HELRODRAFT_76971, partial [Helobdella robusta]|uniref:G-protein coupled receptors family 1 profile domain-containing protein n=1 Tax=Helobdella robusta TaxID=6412 RepID=T1G2S0_HELRO